MIPIIAKSLLSTFMNETKLYTLEQNNYYPQILKKGLACSSLDFGKLHFDNRFNSFHEVLMKYSSLPSLLHYEDRNSMAASIESRVPFLDHRLVELGFQMPNNVKIRNSESKWVLRESMKECLPHAIRDRKDKKGFVTPGEVVWLRNSLKHLLEIDYNKLDFLNKVKTQNEIDSFLKGNNSNASFIWRIASLNYWIKNFN
jgi:asparagine synthase (glutamine-hydrolysing)